MLSSTPEFLNKDRTIGKYTLQKQQGPFKCNNSAVTDGYNSKEVKT